MKRVVVLLAVLLILLHQDFWWWNDASLLLGFIPVGLAWHAGISLAAGFVAFLAVRYCWPDNLDLPDEGGPSRASH